MSKVDAILFDMDLSLSKYLNSVLKDTTVANHMHLWENIALDVGIVITNFNVFN